MSPHRGAPTSLAHFVWQVALATALVIGGCEPTCPAAYRLDHTTNRCVAVDMGASDGGVVEVCDPGGIDEDGDPSTLGLDGDGDGSPAVHCCNLQPDHSVRCGSDCDDTRADVHVGGAEICNGVDDDCDGTVDGAPADDWCSAPTRTGPNVMSSTCVAGSCENVCTASHLDCAVDPGCEASSSDANHCGSCDHSCRHATCSDGVCLGDFVTLGLGASHSCGVRGDGSVQCWGNNLDGAVGDGTVIDRHMPTNVALPSPATAVCAGARHSCAVVGGGVYCWGANDNGQLGDGSTTDRSAPVGVAGLGTGTFVEVACGGSHTCARTSSGTVRCWGSGSNGQLGDASAVHSMCGFTDCSLSPVDVVGLADVLGIGTGTTHSCAVRSTGAVMCWGDNRLHELGDGTTTSAAAPTPVTGLADATAIATTDHHACVVRRSGSVRCWGFNAKGQLGDGSTVARTSPVDVVGLADVASVAAGSIHSCAATRIGAVFCWGDPDAVGTGATGLEPAPVMVVGLSDGALVTAGGGHACSLSTHGVLSCWGSNSQGQLGDGSTAARYTPVPVIDP